MKIWNLPINFITTASTLLKRICTKTRKTQLKNQPNKATSFFLQTKELKPFKDLKSETPKKSTLPPEPPPGFKTCVH